MIYYKLTEDKEVVKCPKDERINFSEREVSKDILSDGKVLSTVFLITDYNFMGEGPPIFFETMLFPSKSSFSELLCKRYCTYKEAVESHEKLKVLLEKMIAAGVVDKTLLKLRNN